MIRLMSVGQLNSFKHVVGAHLEYSENGPTTISQTREGHLVVYSSGTATAEIATDGTIKRLP